MKSVRFAVVLPVLVLVLMPFAGRAADGNPGLARCLAGLQAAAAKAEAERPEINAAYIRELGMRIADSAEGKVTPAEGGTPRDTLDCVGRGLWLADVKLLGLALNGYLPTDPMAELVKCRAAFFAMGRTLGPRIGPARAGQFDDRLTQEFKPVMRFVSQLFGGKWTLAQLDEAASEKLEAMPADDPRHRMRQMQSYIDSCGWFDVPLKPVLDGVGIGLGQQQGRGGGR